MDKVLKEGKTSRCKQEKNWEYSFVSSVLVILRGEQVNMEEN